MSAQKRSRVMAVWSLDQLQVGFWSNRVRGDGAIRIIRSRILLRDNHIPSSLW